MKKLRFIICLALIGIYFITNIYTVNAQKYSMAYLYGNGDYISFVNSTNGILDEVSPSYYDLIVSNGLTINTIDKGFINSMHEQGIKVVPFLSNHWDREAGREALSNMESVANKVVNSIVENNLDGINVDIENLTEKDKDAYTDFVRILRKKLPIDKILVVSVAANPYNYETGWHGSYDYQKLGEISDYIVIMAYDEHYEGGEAGSVAGIEFVEDSINYAIERVEMSKVVLGVPLYGRYWKEGFSYGGRAVSLTQMEEIIKKYNGTISYDEKTKSMKAKIEIKTSDEKPKIYGYTLTSGVYNFYYENEDSISEKLDLINKYNIKGVGVWRLGMEPKSLWNVFFEKLAENFQYFVDVPDSYWASNYVNFVKEEGIVEGKTDNTYEPESYLTRGEMATIIRRIIEKNNLNINNNYVSNFNDISSHWSKENIDELSRYGIITGYVDGSFRPDNRVTRAEASKMIAILLEKLEMNNENSLYESMMYSDMSNAHWAYKYIASLSERNILNGYNDGTFKPDYYMTRAEIAKIIQKVIE